MILGYRDVFQHAPAPADVERRQCRSVILLDGTYRELNASGSASLSVVAVPKVEPASAVQLQVASSNAADVDTTGAGAWVVRATLLRADGQEVVSAANLNGQTAVNIGGTGTTEGTVGVIDAEVYEAGSNGVQSGDIHFGTGAFTAGVPPASTHWGMIPAQPWGSATRAAGRLLTAAQPIPADREAVPLRLSWELEVAAWVDLYHIPAVEASAPFSPSRFLWGGQLPAGRDSVEFSAAPGYIGPGETVGIPAVPYPIKSVKQAGGFSPAWVAVSGRHDGTGGYASVTLDYALRKI